LPAPKKINAQMKAMSQGIGMMLMGGYSAKDRVTIPAYRHAAEAPEALDTCIK